MWVWDLRCLIKKNLNLLILLPKGDMGYKLKYKI